MKDKICSPIPSCFSFYIDDYDTFCEYCEYFEECKAITKVETEKERIDNVNHPAHYTQGKYETIEIIEDILGDNASYYCWGNIIKYICRWKGKGGIEDLEKAKWYIDRLIQEE